jgi:predicted nucleic acid-binding protein
VRVVLDTDVMVAALRSSRGASRQLLFFALNRRFDLLLYVPLMLEYEAVSETTGASADGGSESRGHRRDS